MCPKYHSMLYRGVDEGLRRARRRPRGIALAAHGLIRGIDAHASYYGCVNKAEMMGKQMEVFKDAMSDRHWLRTVGHASYGGAEIGVCLAVGNEIGRPQQGCGFSANDGLLANGTIPAA